MKTTLPQHVRSVLSPSLLCIAMLATTAAPAAHAQASEASALSLLLVAMVSTVSTALLASGVTLSVVSVEASAQGAVCVLERASDGVRATLNFSGQAAMAVGASIVVTATVAGWVLSDAGKAVAFVPNESSASLLYNERVTR